MEHWKDACYQEQHVHIRLAKATDTMLDAPSAVLQCWPHANVESCSWSNKGLGKSLSYREAGFINRGCMLLPYTASGRHLAGIP